MNRWIVFAGLLWCATLSAANSPIEEKANPIEFVRIAPGEFIMGCSPQDTYCREDEKPAHHVRITKGFEMSKYMVPQAQWQAAVDALVAHMRQDRPADGFIAAIAICSEVLARHFPPGGRSHNALPDRIYQF